MKLFKLLIIPLFLTFLYFALFSYPYFFSKINRYDSLGPLSLVEEQSVNIQKTFSPDRRTDEFDNRLFKDEKVTVKIKASENNFGIVLFRFAKLSEIVSDTVVFRIKEEGKSLPAGRQEKWYYENTYQANQFQDNQYFTFGFPPFKNSKNNTYVFEIESLAGTGKNGIGVSPDKPQVALVYKYTRGDLTNLNTLPPFIFKKFVYAARNANILANWQLLAALILPPLLIISIKKKKITAKGIVGFFKILKKNPREALRVIINDIKSDYLSLEKKNIYFIKKLIHWFSPTKFYLLFLNTNTKKRIAIGLLIFLLAFTYRFSSSLVNQRLFFYAGLGGQGDYDQFIRAATCALNFCSYAILGQNFLIETSILGMFYEIFGFVGGLKSYLYLMLILSSIIATLPYLLLSRKSWITLGGILGSLFLATSDFLTQMSLNFPPDNGSLFTFSMFFVVYLLTINIGTIKWLLLFGLMGTIDGLNKALFLINNPVALGLFSPVFFYEKVREGGKSLFRKKSIKILFLSLLPLLVFITIYSAWEIFVQLKFSAPYWLRGLIHSRGISYVSYTSFDDSSFTESIVSQLFYLFISAIVMIKRLIDYTDLRIIYLAPIFLGLLLLTFAKRKFPVKKFILIIISSALLVFLLISIKDNYLKIHDIFPVEYIKDNWKTQTYVRIFLFIEIIALFIINFKYSALKLSFPILPYVVMLIILTKNSPFPRLHTHVVAWSIILLAYLVNWIMMNIGKFPMARIRIILGMVILALFTYAHIFPKMTIMATQLNSGIAASQNQVRYLKWIEEIIPENAVILAGGKSDLVILAENVKRPVIYNTLWSAAVLIKPKEVPGVTPDDFHLVRELKNKENFKRKKYIILEDDIYLWRARVSGAADNLFSTNLTTLNAEDYSLRVYKYNPTLKKAIYELNMRDSFGDTTR